MNSFEKWDSLDKALKRIRRNAAALFVFCALFDIVGFVGLAFILYCDARNEVWAFFALLIGFVPIVLSPYLLYVYYHNKHDRYSIFTLLSKNAVCGEKFDDAIRNAQSVGSRIAATKEALYSLKFDIPFVIPADDIVWLYTMQRWYYKHPDPILYVVTKDKQVHRLPLSVNLILSKALDPLRMVYPHLFFGYTAENKALFKDRFSEMAERAKK
jgi:hypothetical protein